MSTYLKQSRRHTSTTGCRFEHRPPDSVLCDPALRARPRVSDSVHIGSQNVWRDRTELNPPKTGWLAFATALIETKNLRILSDLCERRQSCHDMGDGTNIQSGRVYQCQKLLIFTENRIGFGDRVDRISRRWNYNDCGARSKARSKRVPVHVMT